jgi:choline dehydrogenase-like flavoprotein
MYFALAARMTERERIVVVGTGPAGATAGLFLSRAGLDPLLLEAGSGNAALGFTARIRGVTVAKSKPALRTRRDVSPRTDPAAVLFEELAPGGLSNHWSCAVPRFSPDDFTDAERAGEPYTWPLGYADLLPWYERVEPLLKIAGTRRDVPNLPACVATNARSLGADWQAPAALLQARGRDVVVMPYAYGAETTATGAGTPFNAFKRLVAPSAHAGLLGVRYDSRAVKLEWSERLQRVTAVICTDPRTGSEERIPCRAVVLAAGAVRSAQILLASQSADHPHGLGNHAGLVGRYLHDHPLAKLVIRLGRRIENDPASYITRPALDRSEPLYAAAFMQWGGVFERARNLLQGHPGKSARLGFSVFGTMIPSPDDGIALRPNGSAVDYSLAYPERAIEVLEQAKDELLAALRSADWQPQVDVFRVEAPGTSVHYAGTCRMHRSPQYGVVDARSRVFGAPNVIVADSAVFTTGPEKNPVLTAMALSARAAELLAADVHGGSV